MFKIVRAALLTGAFVTSTATSAELLPALKAIANKIAIKPYAVQTIKFGEPLNVTLELPAELGGQNGLPRASSGPGALISLPGTSSLHGGLSDRGTNEHRSPAGAPPAGGAVKKTPTSLLVDIPCESLPIGCPTPITLPVDPNAPAGTVAATLSNFELHIEWRVVSIDGSTRSVVARDKYRADIDDPTRQLSPFFILPPLHVVDFAVTDPPLDNYAVEATVNVTATLKDPASVPIEKTVESGPITKAVPFDMPALPVPTVFVLLQHPMTDNKNGAAAIYLPKGSRLDEAALSKAAGLFDTYNQVSSRLAFVGWFGDYLTGLNALGAALAVPHVSIKERKDFENNLNEDDFVHYRKTEALDDIEVEDESSSLVMLGLPCTGVKFWQDRYYKGHWFVVRTDKTLAVLIRDFKTMKAEPQEALAENTYTGSANDSLSSFRWQLPDKPSIYTCETMPRHP